MNDSTPTLHRNPGQRDAPGRGGTLIVLALLVTAQLWLLAGELQFATVELNDSLFHLGVCRRMVEAVQAGENPLDCWVPEWSFGYPVPRTYQPLGHLGVALLYVVLGGSVSLEVLFAWVRLVLLALLPLSFYGLARSLEFNRRESLAAAFLSPLISTPGLFGLEYGSFLWRGSGLFSQLVASHAFLWAVGTCYRSIGRGRLRVTSGVLLALTFLSHMIYGYMAAFSALLAALLPSETPWKKRLYNLSQSALVCGLLTAWFLLPIFWDGGLVNRSVWESSWKWDSYGLAQVSSWAVSGQLLDAGRFPGLSLLALGGLLWSAWRWRRGKALPGIRFALAGTATWFFLYAGRESWGPLFSLLLLPGRVHLHRLIGGAHVFLVLLAAVAVAGVLDFALSRPLHRHRILALSLLLPLLFLPALERWQYVGEGAAMGNRHRQQVALGSADLENLRAQLESAPGRIFPGLAGGWGKDVRVGDAPLFVFISRWGLPAVSFLYHSMATSGDLMVRLDERRPSHFRLFNISQVVADRRQPLPDWLLPAGEAGRFQIRSADGGGYFELVRVPYRARIGEPNNYLVNDSWLQSDWPDRRLHIRLDSASARADLPSLPADFPGGGMDPPIPCGLVLSEARIRQRYSALVETRSSCYLLFKMTYHPNWRVMVDEQPGPAPVNLSPGFVGVPLEPGRHTVRLEYRAEAWKMPLLLIGILLTLGFGLTAARLQPALWKLWETGQRALESAWSRPKVPAALFTLLICSPLIAPLCTGWLPGGHDVFEYLGRQVEFHENIRHGVVTPDWAGDLSSGFGQPFFQYNPPLFYYFGEIGLLLGLNWAASLNLAVILLILISAVSARLLGRFWFREVSLGSLSPRHAELVGWLAAIAYLYAPYYAVDLYVRRALAEFAALAFCPLALYGFARFALRGSRSGLLLSALGYAAVIGCHLPTALLFSPLLASFVFWSSWRSRSWRRLGGQLLGIAAGLGLSAWVWIPPALERDQISVDRLLEGYLHFGNHFVYLQQLVYSAWGYGISAAGYLEDKMPFSLGLPHLILLGATLLAVFRPRRRGFPQREQLPAGSGFLLGALAVSIFFLLPVSEFVWLRLRWLQYIEFPWRILGVAILCQALLVATLLGWVLRRKLESPLWFGIISALLILPGLAHLAPPGYFVIDAEEWTPGQIASRGVAVTTRREYQPKDFVPGAAYELPYEVLQGRAELRNYQGLPNRLRFEAQLEERSLLLIRKAFFPGWKAEVDGQSAPVLKTEQGWIALDLEAGSHHVRLSFAGSPARRWGKWASLLTFLGLLTNWGLAGKARLPAKLRLKLPRQDPRRRRQA